MSLNLRPYQNEMIAEARRRMQKGVRSILLQSPTGSGKTVLTAHMLKTAADKGMASWFVVHRRELVKQSIRTFAEVGINHGVIAAGFQEDLRQPIQIASVQTLARRIGKTKTPKLIVWDECHHVAAGSWSKIHASFTDSFHIGLTATPERLDGTGLNQWFQSMIDGPSVTWLIENKFLSPYKLYAPSSVSTEGIHTRMGDFARNELSSAVDKPTITGDAIKHYLKLAAGKKAVVFCVSIEHSKHVVEQFLKAGIEAAHVDGETDPEERDKTIRRFENGEIKVLSNVELFGEGFDLPSLEAVVLLRPTQSLGLYLQQVGRALRTFPGKEHAIILDHAGNVKRHGLPDEERFWQLCGRDLSRSRGKDSDNSVRICPECFAAQFFGRETCVICGCVFPKKPREIEKVEGELVEIDLEKMRWQAKKEQSKAQSFEELVALGRSRGYKRPEFWAKHVFNARQAKKLRRVA